MGRASLYLK